MSRSYKKLAVSANSCAKSEKKDKRRAHGATRAHFRTSLESCGDLEQFQFIERSDAHSEVWTFAKDGRHLQRVRAIREGRALKPLKLSATVRDARQMHRAYGK